MQTYEYKVVPAPNRSKRVKGVKGTAGRFAAVLTEAMNDLAADGWEYLRSDSLPVEEKPGLLKSRVETYLTVLVFRRPMAGAEPEQPMAGYIEDKSDDLDAAPMAEAEPDTQAEADFVEETDIPQEPAVSSEWSEEPNYPQEPPLTSQGDDSPFAQPENTEPRG